MSKLALIQLGIKRAIDIVGASTGLVLCAPLFAVVALLVRLESPGPAFFGHERMGLQGRRFRCLKFRSMHCEAEDILRLDDRLRAEYERNHFKLSARCDPRVTRLGRFLRVTSIDELPQLWNVLVGDMSLVGPRPIVERELRHYGAHADLLLSMRPGLTGAWAVAGRSDLGYPRRAEVELSYVQSWTIVVDLRILTQTPWAVLFGRGAV